MPTYNELKNKLTHYAYEQRIPITGEFEITSNCNFNCEMCYAKTNDPVLTKSDWFHLFDMAQSNGMLYALLTGGEVFLHPDFIEIYNYLFDLGVKITLFTNGSKLTQAILNTLKKRPPEMVVITIYGYDQSSYKLFTQTDAFREVDQTIDLLKENKISLYLRTIPLPMIYLNLDAMIQYAKSKDLTLGYFLYVSKVKGQTRLTPKELLDFERRLKNAFPVKTLTGHFALCTAFKNSYFITHKGYMQACPMMPIPTKKVNDQLLETFVELQKEWEEMLSQSPCSKCELNQNCMTCLARRHLEGNVLNCAEYLKEIAKEKTNA